MDPEENITGKENDYLTCGKCQLEFPLQNITTFMEHKKQECEGPDETFGGALLQSSGLQCVSCPKAFVTAVGMLLHAQATHNLQLFLTKGQYTAGIKNLMVSSNTQFSNNSSNDVPGHELQVSNYKSISQSLTSLNVDPLKFVSSDQYVTISANIQPKITSVPLTNSSCSNSAMGTLGVKKYVPNAHILPTTTTVLSPAENFGKQDIVIGSLTDKNSSCSEKETQVLVDTQLLPKAMKYNRQLVEDILFVKVQEEDKTPRGSSLLLNKERSLPALHQVHNAETQNHIEKCDLEAKTFNMSTKEISGNYQWQPRPFVKKINQSKTNFKKHKDTNDHESFAESKSSDGNESVETESLNDLRQNNSDYSGSDDKDEGGICTERHFLFTDYKNSENLDPLLLKKFRRVFETPGCENMKKCCSAVVPKKRKRHYETNHSQHSHRHYPYNSINYTTLKHGGHTVHIDQQSQTEITDDIERAQKFDKSINEGTCNQRIESTQLSKNQNYEPVQVLHTSKNNKTELNSLDLQPGYVVAIPVSNTVSTSVNHLKDSAFYTSGAMLRLPRKSLNSTLPANSSTVACNNLPTSSRFSTGYMLESQPVQENSLPVDTTKDGRDEDEEGTVYGRKRRYPTCRPFKCGQCDSAFNQRIHLKKHMCKHTGIKPYKCQQCDYSTVERSHLKVHIRIHTGEKPFKCQYCEYATAQNSTLKIHQKRHHHAPKDQHQDRKFQKQHSVDFAVENTVVKTTSRNFQSPNVPSQIE